MVGREGPVVAPTGRAHAADVSVGAAYTPLMLEVASRRKAQPPPPRVVFAALSNPYRDLQRPWLHLLADEQPPQLLDQDEPHWLVWSSLWRAEPNAQIRFDLLTNAGGQGTDLRWTLLLPHEPPDVEVRDLRRRLDRLINADLRFTFGQ